MHGDEWDVFDSKDFFCCFGLGVRNVGDDD